MINFWSVPTLTPTHSHSQSYVHTSSTPTPNLNLTLSLMYSSIETAATSIRPILIYTENTHACISQWGSHRYRKILLEKSILQKKVSIPLNGLGLCFRISCKSAETSTPKAASDSSIDAVMVATELARRFLNASMMSTTIRFETLKTSRAACSLWKASSVPRRVRMAY